MQDQVRLLGEMGVAATFLNSTLSAAEASARGAALLRGDYRLLYVAPRSEEHTSELQSLMRISYAVFCLKKKTLIYISTRPHYDLLGLYSHRPYYQPLLERLPSLTL